ncbi:adenylate cyclase type 10-like [Larus michahellis]|uniref:adenylate cyclase type 10-like n=1 Tax=Larus michahellis TaxID=119627 RepID=UPI003D9B5222
MTCDESLLECEEDASRLVPGFPIAYTPQNYGWRFDNSHTIYLHSDRLPECRGSTHLSTGFFCPLRPLVAHRVFADPNTDLRVPVRAPLVDAEGSDKFLIFGGDILKFAGDAVLVLWRTPPQEVARTISLVLHCSQQIQKKYGRRDTDVGQKIQLKIGISAGTMSLPVFGDESWQHFCIFGPCLAEVRDAEEVAGAGEVVLSATCWELCEQHRLRIKHLAGTRAVQVTGMDPMPWSECQDALRKLVQDPVRHRSKREGAMRPTLLLPSDLNAKDVLRKYIPVAALGKLDAGLPMDLLSELRPVTCIFVQLQLAAGTSSVHLSTVLKEASRVMLEILSPHKGHINKVLLCDKGCTFLCVLGLPGNKLPCESLHALQSALEIFDSCSTMLEERE